jgi:hypothetical protein
MDTQKISMMKLIEAELQHRVQETEPELSRIDMIVRLSEVRTTIADLQQDRPKPASISLPASSGAQAS